MDEAAIRMWALDRTIGATMDNPDGTKRALKLNEGLEMADQLAAWVMSGRLPATSAT